eukprot:1155833-Pelagomonas_calceolata.AAC.11
MSSHETGKEKAATGSTGMQGLPAIGVDPIFVNTSRMFDPEHALIAGVPSFSMFISPNSFLVSWFTHALQAALSPSDCGATLMALELNLFGRRFAHCKNGSACKARQLYNTSKAAGQLNQQGIPYGFFPSSLPGKLAALQHASH